MIHHDPIAARTASFGATLSPYPASFDGSGWLYFVALTALMSLAMGGACVAGWMVREIWRDRFNFYPTRTVFRFRLMMMFVGLAAFMRALPEVAYDTCYGEVTGYRIAQILVVKRVADIFTLPIFATWVTLLVLIHTAISIENAGSPGIRSMVYADALSAWPRLVKPALIFALIVLIAGLMAYGKWTLGHHAG